MEREHFTNRDHEAQAAPDAETVRSGNTTLVQQAKAFYHVARQTSENCRKQQQAEEELARRRQEGPGQ